MASLNGKVFAITGGASGIGLATAKGLAEHGAIVCIADVALGEAAAAYFTEQGYPHMLSTVDVSKKDDVEGWMSSIMLAYGRLDGAANCAGIIGNFHGLRPVADIDDDDWHKYVSRIVLLRRG